jgi:TDG/mug DNA glycosylase family protein
MFAVQSLPPIARTDARILILGSMPGEASLRAGQYYAHPRNSFWRIMGVLFGAEPAKPYAERLAILQENGVAIWDVLRSCVRPGSLDTNISKEVPNDFAAFFATHRSIVRIGLNGGKAGATFKEYAAQYLPAHAVVVQLPSTSPAHASRSFEQKCAAWRSALALA